MPTITTINRDQAKENESGQKMEEGTSRNGAENLQNLKWERHFYYHEEEERQVTPLFILPVAATELFDLLELYD